MEGGGRFMETSYDSKFQSRVALETLRGDLTVAEIADRYQVHPDQVQQRKKKLMEGVAEFSSPGLNGKNARCMPRTI